jgi:hypothetical protein
MKTIPLPRLSVPRMARVRQNLKDDRITEPRKVAREKLLGAGLQKKISPGARIAITAGSRGLGDFVELLSGICDAIKSAGGEPFIIPSMGSHGGASDSGQEEVLRRLGVKDDVVGAPIKSSMDTVTLGVSKSGATAHIDSIAAQAEGIIVLGGVKLHPENAEGIASGLLKMTTVGLGKQIGAQEAHSHGLWESVAAVPEVTLNKAKILFGVAVVENAFRKPVRIEVVPGKYDAFKELDQRLLKIAHEYFARIPFQHLDLLIVDEVGKNISGSGMDLNVIGSWRNDGGKAEPDFRRIVALSLTSSSLGNGLGIGLADFTTKRFLDEYDPQNTYINLLTASEPGSHSTREGPMPLALPTDKDAIEIALYSALPKGPPRICRIKNTARVDEFWASEALLEEVEGSSGLVLAQAPVEMQFDARGNLF